MSRKWRRFKNRRLGEVPQKVSEYIPQPVSETGEKGWKAVDRGTKIRFAIFLAIMAAMIIFTISLIPYLGQLVGEESRAELVTRVRAAGPFGILILLAIQVIQVIVAFIPGEVVQIVAGTIYGTWGGLAVCLGGCALASAFVFWLVGKLGMPFVKQMVSDEQAKKFSFLQENDKIDIITFILFLIPGLPKDVITYLIPITGMPLKRFLLLSLPARVPGLLASTYGGAALLSGNYGKMILIFVVFGGLGALGIWKRDKILSIFHKKKDEPEQVEAESVEDAARERAAKKARVKYKKHTAPDIADGVMTDEEVDAARRMGVRERWRASREAGKSGRGRKWRKRDNYDAAADYEDTWAVREPNAGDFANEYVDVDEVTYELPEDGSVH